MSEVLLSVAIPTYNRYKYLRECVKTISGIQSEKLEIVISDNTLDNNEILDYINSLNDCRIKYFHHTEHLGEMGNCEMSIFHTTGKYVCMIGDDDTICPNMIDAVEFMDKNGIDACCMNTPGFNWPDVTFEGRKKEANLFYPRKASGAVRIIDAQEELKKSLSIGGMLLVHRMPRAYHGIVSRECLLKIKETAGCFCPGPSPDMANATAVCLVSKKAAIFEDYLMISGYGHASCKEGGKMTHSGKLEEKKWLPQNIADTWNPNLPKFFSSETIFAESCLKSLEAMKADEYIKLFNFSHCYARFLYKHREAMRTMMIFCIKKPVRFFMLAKGIYQCYAHRIKGGANYKEEQDIHSLYEALGYTERLRGDVKYYYIEN